MDNVLNMFHRRVKHDQQHVNNNSNDSRDNNDGKSEDQVESGSDHDSFDPNIMHDGIYRYLLYI